MAVSVCALTNPISSQDTQATRDYGHVLTSLPPSIFLYRSFFTGVFLGVTSASPQPLVGVVEFVRISNLKGTYMDKALDQV